MPEHPHSAAEGMHSPASPAYIQRAGLLLCIAALHLLMAWLLAASPPRRFDDAARPLAMEVVFVREVMPTALPARAPKPTAAPAPATSPPPSPSEAVAHWVGHAALPTEERSALEAPLPASAASAPWPAPPSAQPASATPTAVALAASRSTASSAATPHAVATAAPLPPAASEAVAATADQEVDAFDWPASTALRYDIQGHFRGPIYGRGEVLWLRDGERYQVRIQVEVDPGISRTLVSEGQVGSAGLTPERYDEIQAWPFIGSRTNRMQFTGSEVVLANAKRLAKPAQLQDTASQFVQMIWGFRSGRLASEIGTSFTYPLALPFRLGDWTYDVTERKAFALPFLKGQSVDAFHVVPRPGASLRGNEMAVDLWIAPTLQHLPVAMRIRVDSETEVSLTLREPPLQAAPASAAPTASAPPAVK